MARSEHHPNGLIHHNPQLSYGRERGFVTQRQHADLRNGKRAVFRSHQGQKGRLGIHQSVFRFQRPVGWSDQHGVQDSSLWRRSLSRIKIWTRIATETSIDSTRNTRINACGMVTHRYLKGVSSPSATSISNVFNVIDTKV